MNTIDKYDKYVITSMVGRIEPVVFEKAEGATVFAEDGSQYIDCFSGISVTSVGHSNPEVIAAAKSQIDKWVHNCSYVYYNSPMADLAEKLALIAPGQLQKSFFANSGAEAVEGALRLVKVYTGKREIIALQGSFHGRSYATLSITGNWARKKRSAPYMPGVSFAPVPYCYRCAFNASPDTCGMQCAEYIEDIIRYNTAGDVAAFVAEPILGEGGLIVPPEPYFKKVKEVLGRHQIHLIIDEVQTGFGRIGKMFGIEHYGVEPDIMTLGKGIANGFPLSAFIAKEPICDAFLPGEHLTTFGGNPVSCAAALATINFIEREKLAEQAAKKELLLKERLESVKKKHPIIGDIRGKGLMIGVELVKDATKTPAVDEAKAIRNSCREKGILIGVGGVFANVLRIQPPLPITEKQLLRVVDIIEDALEKL